MATPPASTMATMSEPPERAEVSEGHTGSMVLAAAALPRAPASEKPDPDRADAPVGQADPWSSRALGGPPNRADGSPPARNWVQRSERDRRARARLEIGAGEGVIVLNDRRIPGEKASIKLIAVSPAGVFVIDARSYKGLVHTKRLGPMSDLGPDELHVGRKNCTSSVEEVARQVEAVRSALSTKLWTTEVPVHAMLCLTRAEWGFASALQISDVWVGWPKLLAGRVQTPVVMDSPTVQEVYLMIADHLPTT
jgi:Nuclease-related domain